MSAYPKWRGLLFAPWLDVDGHLVFVCYCDLKEEN
jgi:hypothetical protein